MVGISKAERLILCLTAVFCVVVLAVLGKQASTAPEVQVSVHRAPLPEQVEEHHALMDGERIDINTADLFELQRLPGIGEKRAGDILAYREACGGFTCLEELLLIPGIGEKTLEKISQYAVIG